METRFRACPRQPWCVVGLLMRLTECCDSCCWALQERSGWSNLIARSRDEQSIIIGEGHGADICAMALALHHLPLLGLALSNVPDLPAHTVLKRQSCPHQQEPPRGPQNLHRRCSSFISCTPLASLHLATDVAIG